MKYFYNNNITTPQHPPKVKYTGTVTVNEQQHERPTSDHVAMGGNGTEADQLTGRRKAKWPIGL